MPLYPVKEKLAAGQPVFGTMITECLRPEVVAALAACGVDFFIIDTEHSPGDLHEIEALARAARHFGIAPLVRITDNEYFLIARTLDCGAAGVVMPRIHCADDARRVVEAVKYPPAGKRGFGLRSIHTDFSGMGTAEAIERANRETIIVVQVEYQEALDDLENIVAVPGVDATMIGPQDLSISLGVPGQFGHETMTAAFRRVAEVCGRSPVAAGIHMGDLARLLELKAEGYRFLIYSADLALIMQALKQGIQALRSGASSAPAKAGIY
jgi:2-keto-3-deoxy-L-rhamnonate aldolase RhmA